MVSSSNKGRHDMAANGSHCPVILHLGAVGCTANAEVGSFATPETRLVEKADQKRKEATLDDM